jgi:hypothetical protein
VLVPVQALQVLVVEVVDAHAVMKSEIWVAVHASSTWAGVTNAGTSELDTLDAGVGQTGPESTTPPLLEPLLPPELDPEELPELDPDELPELDPEEPPELDPDEPPELPPLPPPDPLPELEPLPPPLPDPLLEPEPPPLPLPDPLLDPEPPPLPEPVPVVQACVAARLHEVVSAHDAQLNVCAPTV